MRESIECLSATGEKMRLEVIEHGDAGSAKEFIVAAPKFNFKKWFSLTVALSFISLTCELYISDLRVLGVILSLLCLALLVKLHKKIKLESLLVVSSLGLQHTTLYASGRRETFFLSRQRLKSVLIVEGISMQRILFYLAIVLNSKTDLPRLNAKNSMKKREDCSDLDPSPILKNCQKSYQSNEQKSLCEDHLPSTEPVLKSFDEDNLSSSLSEQCPHSRISTEDVVYPLFQSLWPRLDVLTVIYRGLEKTLFPQYNDKNVKCLEFSSMGGKSETA